MGRWATRPIATPCGRSGSASGSGHRHDRGSSARAAMAASRTIPIVFLSQSDPINSGFVASFNRPGGNATGMALLTGPLVAKRLELVLQLAPADAPVGYLMNPQATAEPGEYL